MNKNNLPTFWDLSLHQPIEIEPYLFFFFSHKGPYLKLIDIQIHTINNK